LLPSERPESLRSASGHGAGCAAGRASTILALCSARLQGSWSAKGIGRCLCGDSNTPRLSVASPLGSGHVAAVLCVTMPAAPDVALPPLPRRALATRDLGRRSAERTAAPQSDTGRARAAAEARPPSGDLVMRDRVPPAAPPAALPPPAAPESAAGGAGRPAEAPSPLGGLVALEWAPPLPSCRRLLDCWRTLAHASAAPCD